MLRSRVISRIVAPKTLILLTFSAFLTFYLVLGPDYGIFSKIVMSVDAVIAFLKGDTFENIKTMYRATDLTYGLLTHDDYFNDWEYNRAPVCEGGYRCRFTDSPKNAHAVLIQSSHFSFAPLAEMEKARTPKQRWILFSWETPINGYIPLNGPWRFRFNWTATYMRRSDIYTPFSIGFRPTKRVPSHIRLKDKPHMAFAVMTNCKAPERMGLILKLRKYFPVDIYGKCGKYIPLGIQHIYQLTRSYKFYLAVENCQCRDFISEKFWKNGLQGFSVPVVLGGYDPSDVTAVAPPNSFIHFRDFVSTKDLAQFLIDLSKDETKYQSYFEWKKKYEIIEESMAKTAICNICRRLHTDTVPSVKDLSVDWNSKLYCRPTSVRTIFNKTYDRKHRYGTHR